MVEMLKELKIELKNNPKEIISGVVFLVTLFGLYYISIWTICPC